MNPVTDAPYGSVESFARIFRQVTRRPENIAYGALGIIQAIAGDLLPDAVKVERIRNVAAAADLVDDEMTGREDELLRLRTRVAELEANDAHGFSRTDADPQSLDQRRVPAHFQHGTDDGVDEISPAPSPTYLDEQHGLALDEDNRRAQREIEKRMRLGETGRVTNPKLARFLAKREDAKRSQGGAEPESVPF